MTDIDNHLSSIRRQRGLSAVQLARLVGVSRQTIYAMEAGTYIPNTAVTLQLARALDVQVEDLFRLKEHLPPRTTRALLLQGAEHIPAGQPVQLCRVDRRIVASAPAPIAWYLPVADAVVLDRKRKNAKVQLFAKYGSVQWVRMGEHEIKRQLWDK